MEGDFIKINKWLLPLSCFYGIGVKFRNLLFEMGVLKSRSFNVPVISVGNITVGGTGKTPHTEYLGRLLRDYFNVAILSRGYKRKSKGFLVASAHTTMQEIGDEPYQMKQKFADITVAVDKDRCHGIEQLSEHNILLVDYHRLIIYDKLLPAGRLREPMNGKDRADIVIVTKCPKDLKPMEFRVITKAMSLYPYQQLFFTTLVYDELKPVFAGNKQALTLSQLKDRNVLLLTGIASPEQLEHDLSPLTHLTPLAFNDHHQFNKKDITLINDTFASMQSPKCIITTEKDATRMQSVEGFSDEVRQHTFVIPVRIEFMLEQEETFNKYISGYVRKNSRNSILVKRKDDIKPQDSNHSGDRPRTISFRDNRKDGISV